MLVFGIAAVGGGDGGLGEGVGVPGVLHERVHVLVCFVVMLFLGAKYSSEYTMVNS